MKINMKSQTTRSTQWKEGINCVNLFLSDPINHAEFEIGLQVTEWGSKKPIDPLVIIQVDGKEHRHTVASLIKSYREAEAK